MEIPSKLKLTAFFTSILLFTSHLLMANPSSGTFFKSRKDTSRYISDLVLIYQGGTHRLPWNTSQLKPYIYRESDKGFEWLFDGFLFIEYKDNKGAEYAPGYEQRAAGKAEWQFLIDRNFEKGKALHALENSLDSLAKKGHKPQRQRQVYLTLPDPIKGFKEWGKIGDKTIDFDKKEDRLAAAKWHIDEALRQWKASKFKHIKLAGFYWVAENNLGSEDIIAEIAAYVNKAKLRLSWIPYYHAEGAADWKKMGFNLAYQQPNYFFNLSTPYHTLPDAIAFAKQHQMALEMEFDERALYDANFMQRYYDYLHEFEKHGIWKDFPVAYYQSNTAWLDMANSKSPEIKTAMKKLEDLIAERQKKTDLRIGKKKK